MTSRKKEGSLSSDERRIVKALLHRGQRNQDIQALLNVGRAATVNSARITEVKKNQNIRAASDEEVDRFISHKRAFDQTLGINPFERERLFRCREAMMMAAHVFNSPVLKFKTELFAVLANIAWTYLLHEHYERKGIGITNKDGTTFALSTMLSRPDCPVSASVKRNLADLKLIRDSAEHRTVGKSDAKWASLFQATCLNFEKTLTQLFGERLSLSRELSFALQFAKLNIDQITEIQRHQIPEHMEALDARMLASLSDEEALDPEYRFRVIYTLEGAPKGQAHIQRRTKRPFTSHNHTQAWRKFKVRPLTGSAQPSKTNRDFCVFNAAHKDYTFTDAWVNFLCEQVEDDKSYAEIRAF